MNSVIRAIETISRYTGRVSAWIIYVGIAMLFMEVVSRYFFNSPTVWAHGYTQRLFGSYFILIGAFTFLNKGHVRIDLIQSRFSQRNQKIFDIVNCLYLLLWSGVLIPAGWKFFWKSFQLGERDEMVLAHPIWWVKLLLVVGMALIFLQGVAELLKTVSALAKPEKTA